MTINQSILYKTHSIRKTTQIHAVYIHWQENENYTPLNAGAGFPSYNVWS